MKFAIRLGLVVGLLAMLLAPRAEAQDSDEPITILLPDDGETLDGSRLNLAFRASDTDGRAQQVQFFVRDQSSGEYMVGEDGAFVPGFRLLNANPALTRTRWTYSALIPANGDYLVRAIVTDANGVRIEDRAVVRFSVNVKVNLDDTPPIVEIVHPFDGEVLAVAGPGRFWNPAVNATDDSGIKVARFSIRNLDTGQWLTSFRTTFQDEYNSILAACCDEDGYRSQSISIPAGRYRMAAFAIDTAGNRTPDPTIIEFTIEDAPARPGALLFWPQADASYETTVVPVMASIRDCDTGLSLVVRETDSSDYLQADGTFSSSYNRLVIDEDGDCDGIRRDLVLPPGNYQIRSKFIDPEGNLGEATVTRFSVTAPTAPTQLANLDHPALADEALGFDIDAHGRYHVLVDGNELRTFIPGADGFTSLVIEHPWQPELRRVSVGPNGEIVVSDFIELYTLAGPGAPVEDFGEGSVGEFANDGILYLPKVDDVVALRIASSAGPSEFLWQEELDPFVCDAAVDPTTGVAYGAQCSAFFLQAVGPSAPTQKLTATTDGNIPGYALFPLEIAFDASGNVWTADGDVDGRIVIHNPEGELRTDLNVGASIREIRRSVDGTMHVLTSNGDILRFAPQFA